MLGNRPGLTLWNFGDAPVRIDVTFLIVPLLIFALFSSWPVSDSWPIVAAYTLTLFVSVLLHELGHATAARYCKVKITKIVIGGFVGKVTFNPGNIPRTSYVLIVAAGPVANLLVFLALCLTFPVIPIFPLEIRTADLAYGDLQEWLLTTLRLFAFMNILMFAGNLLPVHPLDGGRIFFNLLATYLSHWTSTVVTAATGILAGALAVYYGANYSAILMFFALWLVAINIRMLVDALRWMRGKV